MERAAQRIAEEAKAREVGTLVLGLPKNMDGSEGPRAEKSRAFRELLLRGHGPARGALGRAAQQHRGPRHPPRRREKGTAPPQDRGRRGRQPDPGGLSGAAGNRSPAALCRGRFFAVKAFTSTVFSFTIKPSQLKGEIRMSQVLSAMGISSVNALVSAVVTLVICIIVIKIITKSLTSSWQVQQAGRHAAPLPQLRHPDPALDPRRHHRGQRPGHQHHLSGGPGQRSRPGSVPVRPERDVQPLLRHHPADRQALHRRRFRRGRGQDRHHQGHRPVLHPDGHAGQRGRLHPQQRRDRGLRQQLQPRAAAPRRPHLHRLL